MAQENREITAAVLAAGIMANKYTLQGDTTDADTAVILYHHCLEALDRRAATGAK